MKWNKTTKEIISYSFAGLALLFGLILTAWGFSVPPIGEVHSSIQLILGEMLTFTGAVIGISLHVKNEIGKAKEELTEALKQKYLENQE
ncbi:MAG: hypothetical protein HFJ94_03825 [Muribaculaceae bacterium]|nr:hypothetical protein [Muribaculaceae bacterium]